MSVRGSDAVQVLVGQSPRMLQVLRLVEKLGQCRWPVLVLGETGTGKEVVARAIHGKSSIGPFVTIDCSSLVGSLMESELYGHVKGAFTGAVQTKIGLIEAANGGTAFFDEIGELPLDLQSKLLRVLQEKEFRPVGSSTLRKSDFRTIAATNRDLAEEVKQGAFRRDLYYRLNVVNLRLAPLRERKEDIVPLAGHFLSRYGNGHEFAREAEDAIVGYDWPGNVRELENCVQYMVAVESGRLLHVGDLPSIIQGQIAAKKSNFLELTSAAEERPRGRQPVPEHQKEENASYAARTASIRAPSAAKSAIIPLTQVERRAIIQALDYTNGDRMMAANLLGIGRTTLYRKLKEYRLAV